MKFPAIRDNLETAIDRWYRYRDDAMRKFVIEWAEFNGVSYIDDVKANPGP